MNLLGQGAERPWLGQALSEYPECCGGMASGDASYAVDRGPFGHGWVRALVVAR